MNNLDKVIEYTKLYWQYPVITEKTFYEQNKHNKQFIGVPWATILDKVKNKDKLLNLLYKSCNNNLDNYTCCQHISFRILIPFFKMLNIQTLYTPHKIKNEDEIDGIKIVACPLYAVNIEDEKRNKIFKDVDFLNNSRRYLYSFMGAYNPKWYLTDIRKKILDMKHSENTFIKYTGQWHFEKSVYSELQSYKQEIDKCENHQNNTEEYNKVLLESRYSLCPSGSGPNSIRLWESLACGSIPIVLSDKLDLPYHNLWNKAIIILNENEVYNISSILANISSEKENEMRKYCIEIYNHFRNNFSNTI